AFGATGRGGGRAGLGGCARRRRPQREGSAVGRAAVRSPGLPRRRRPLVGIRQVVVSASAGDAVTNAAFGFQELLQRVGPSGLFARYIDPRLDGKVFPLSVYEACAHPDDLLIYHVSIGEPEVVQFLLGRRERLVLMYHNITPAKYFAALDPAFAGLLACGRSELELLRDRAELALAVSAYNARELEALGYEDVRVSPLPVDITTLRSVEPDPAISAEP